MAETESLLAGGNVNVGVRGLGAARDPAGLHKNPAYSQAVAVSGNTTTIYVGGQNAAT